MRKKIDKLIALKSYCAAKSKAIPKSFDLEEQLSKLELKDGDVKKTISIQVRESILAKITKDFPEKREVSTVPKKLIVLKSKQIIVLVLATESNLYDTKHKLEEATDEDYSKEILSMSEQVTPIVLFKALTVLSNELDENLDKLLKDKLEIESNTVKATFMSVNGIMNTVLNKITK